MQRATLRYRIYAAAFTAAIATVFVVPSIGAASQGSDPVAAHYFCPPVC